MNKLIASNWEHLETNDYFYRRRLISDKLEALDEICSICNKKNDHSHIQQEKIKMRKCHICSKEKVQDFNDNSSKCHGCGEFTPGTVKQFINKYMVNNE